MMSEMTGRSQSRLEPATAWTVLTDSPMKGLALAREAATILSWDEGDQVYLLDVNGQHRSVSRAPGRVLAGTISDNGSLIALLIEGPRLLLLSADLEPIDDRSAPPDPSALAVDPHGRYVAVATRTSQNHFFTRHGRPAGKFETRQALAHLLFVADRPFMVGSASFGSIFGIELHPAGSSGRLLADVVWQEALLSNVGRLTASGDGGMLLTSCFTHGIQRYDLRGHNEGAYHLGGTVSHAVSDFAGRLIAVASLEGELAVLSPGGHVRWRTGLARPAIALEADPLGRFLIYGHASGEIVRLDLEATSRPRDARPAVPAEPAGSGARPASRSIRKPDWVLPVVDSDDRAETAVLAVLDEPPRIGLFTSNNRLQVFTQKGRNLGQAPEILGMGRILRTAPGWIASATDRHVVLFDARRNAATRVDVSLVEVTHVAIRPDSFGLAIVQERDRVGRLTPAGRWIWKKELRSPVEDVAIGPDGYSALTMENGRLEVYDPAGEPVGGFTSDPLEPLCLIEAPDGSPPPVTWLTLARRSQVLRGHDLLGRVVWETPVNWEGWQFHRLGAIALVSAPDGRTLAYDGSGHVRAQGRGTDGGAEVFSATLQGEPYRVARQGVNLICADLAGRVRWRTVADSVLGPFAASTTGVAILIGRDLAWFSADESP
jgi:hypothetical protein